MVTPAERRALLFLSGLVLLGSAVRWYRARSAPPAPGSVRGLDAQRAAVDSARHGHRVQPPRRSRESGRRGSVSRRPARFPIDLDVASAELIDQLPRVGPALARRIVAYRDSCGPFGSLVRLRKVRGVGAALAEDIASLVTFSALPRPSNGVFSPLTAPPNKCR